MRGKRRIDTQWKLISIVPNMLKIHRFGPVFGRRRLKAGRFEHKCCLHLLNFLAGGAYLLATG
jgi:hypothetical protein